MSIATEARPDLSHLPEPVQLRIAVAETQGATWGFREDDDGRDYLLMGPWGTSRWFTLYASSRHVSHRLPDYLNAAAAWGALMEREIHGHDTQTGGLVRCWWYADADCLHRTFGPWDPNLPRAVCLAVLAKHGIPWPATAPPVTD